MNNFNFISKIIKTAVFLFEKKHHKFIFVEFFVDKIWILWNSIGGSILIGIFYNPFLFHHSIVILHSLSMY